MLLIFISQYAAYVNVKNLASQNLYVSNTIRVLNQTANVGYLTKELQSNVRGYLLTDNESLLSTNYKTRMDLKATSDTLSMLVAYDDKQTQRVNELLAITSDILSFSDRILSIYRVYSADSASSIIRNGEGVRMFSLLKSKIGEIDRFENAQLELRRKRALETHDDTILLIIGSGIAGFFITLLSIIFLFQDRYKQRVLKREIYRKERHLNQYLEAIPDGIMVVNPKKEIILVNQSGRELLGLKTNPKNLDELLKETQILDAANGGVAHTTESLSLSKALGGVNRKGAKVNLIKNGTIINIETNARPIYDLNNEIIGAITVYRDITALEKYANDLTSARDTAEQSIRIKDVFLANMSHEIRTPLNAILGFTYLLEKEVRDPTGQEYINYIQVAGRNLLDLINDILDVSKIEVGQFQLDEHPTSLRELVGSVSILIGQRAKEKGVSYLQSISENLPDVIITDKLRLTQILLNVCGNAVKFTEKGSVTLSIEAVGEEINSVRRIRFTVEDTGIGIPENKIEEVFDRFVQASESTTRKFGGTGLGLSIVKSLVHLLEGNLLLESTLNVGSKFTIEFPFTVLKDYDHEVLPAQESFSHMQPANLNLLAAEDNLLNQKLLKALFSRIGLQITVVNNGQEALDKLKTEKFDLILMDIQMPVMDGYTAIKKIRNDLQLNTPIITMTAHAMPGEKDECLRIGASAYISKPFKEREMLTEVFRLTHRDTFANESNKNETMPENASTDSSYVDYQYLSEITGNDLDLRSELINLFQEESEKQLSAINLSIQDNDTQSLRTAIHKYRSSLISVGLLNTAVKYKEIESALIAEKTPENIVGRLKELEAEVNSGLAELQRYR